MANQTAKTDKTVVESFGEYWLEQTLPLTRFSCVLGAATAIFFYPIDVFYLADHAPVMQMFRFYYMLPVSLIWLAMTYVPATKRFIFWAITTTGLPFGLSFIYLLYLVGPSATLYVGIALMQVCLFVVLLFGLPFRFMLAPLTIFIGSLIVCMRLVSVPAMDQVLALTSVLSVTLLGLAVSLQRQRFEYRSYRQRQEIRLLRKSALAEQEERLRWLEGFSGFLRHELRNALAGVSTSVQMIQRHTSSEPVTRYSARAQRSSEFMSRMLDHAAEASNLKGALIDEDHEIVDLASLMEIKVAEYGETYPEQRFEFETDVGVRLFGNGDRFEQAIDKILTNAVEHSDGVEPISTKVQDAGSEVVIDIENSGDQLPSDIHVIFDMFSSTKRRADKNFGIGLYVAKKSLSTWAGRFRRDQGPVVVRGSKFGYRVASPANDIRDLVQS